MNWEEAAQKADAERGLTASGAPTISGAGWEAAAKAADAQRQSVGATAMDASAKAGNNPVQARLDAVQPVNAGLFETPTGRPQGYAAQPAIQDATDTPSSVIAKAGLVDDPGTKMRLFAESRFPNDPDAVSRYGMQDGVVVFRGDDGQLYREGGALGDGLTEVLSSDAPAAVMGAIGGGFGGVPGAALGSGAGESFKKIIANLILNEPQVAENNAFDIMVEGVMGALGQRAGQKNFSDLVDRQSARDLDRFSRPNALALEREAINEGISLTGAEISNVPSLLSSQRVIGKSHGEAGDIMGEFNRNRTEVEIPRAVERRIGEVRHEDLVNNDLTNASQDAVRAAEKERSALSSPEYQAAFASDVSLDPAPVLSKVDEYLKTAKGRGRAALMEARATLFKEGPEGPILDTSVEGLHNAKTAIDAMIDAKQGADAGIDRIARGRLDQTRKALNNVLNKVPEYKRARQVHADNSGIVDEVQESVLGVMAKIKTNLGGNAVMKLFNETTSPRQVALAKQYISKQSPELWDEVTRSYLLNRWIKASREGATGQSGNVGGQFRKLVFGSARQRMALKEALGPAKYAGLDKLMQVLEATTRVQGGDSITHFAQVGEREMARTAAPEHALLKPLGLREWWIDRRTEGWKTDLATALTAPNSLPLLKQLRRLSPRSRKAVGVATQLLLQVGQGTSARQLVPGETTAPPPSETQ